MFVRNALRFGLDRYRLLSSLWTAVINFKTLLENFYSPLSTTHATLRSQDFGRVGGFWDNVMWPLFGLAEITTVFVVSALAAAHWHSPVTPTLTEWESCPSAIKGWNIIHAVLALIQLGPFALSRIRAHPKYDPEQCSSTQIGTDEIELQCLTEEQILGSESFFLDFISPLRLRSLRSCNNLWFSVLLMQLIAWAVNFALLLISKDTCQLSAPHIWWLAFAMLCTNVFTSGRLLAIPTNRNIVKKLLLCLKEIRNSRVDPGDPTVRCRLIQDPLPSHASLPTSPVMFVITSEEDIASERMEDESPSRMPIVSPVCLYIPGTRLEMDDPSIQLEKGQRTCFSDFVAPQTISDIANIDCHWETYSVPTRSRDSRPSFYLDDVDLGLLGALEQFPADQQRVRSEPGFVNDYSPRIKPAVGFGSSMSWDSPLIDADSYPGIGHLDKTGKITRKCQIYCGSSSDVYRGTLLTGNDESLDVAIKVIRISTRHGKTLADSDKRLYRRFEKILQVSCKLQHPNVTPLLGFTTESDIGVLPTLISPWYSNGNVVEYLKMHPHASRPHLLHDAIKGLEYLHSVFILHGDIKGENILVNDTGIACLTDFGISTLISADNSPPPNGSSSSGFKGTLRFLSPEELLEEVTQKLPTDIWKMGCAAIQIMTDKIPYQGLEKRVGVILAILDEQFPMDIQQEFESPGECHLWNYMSRCWDKDPVSRPNAAGLRIHVEETIALHYPTRMFG